MGTLPNNSSAPFDADRLRRSRHRHLVTGEQLSDSPLTPERESDSPLPPGEPASVLVGIGASAGGLESLERFFSGVTQSSGAAFVVVQHLSPNYETMMDRLLARHTQMPVTIASDGQRVDENSVYVIPPRKDLEVRDGRLVLTEKDSEELPHLPIDRFFSSMASAYGSNCAAVVLSGTGSDGSRGVREVQRTGGLVLSEAESTARFTGMPASAQSTGCVDYSVPPESMGNILLATLTSGMRDVTGNQPVPGAELQKIFDIVRERCRIDFLQYKSSTVSRRIDRRLKMCGLRSLSEYIHLLETDPAEVQALYQDMLIGVTRFFRDAPCFEYLESRVIPDLLERADPKTGLRIWVAGCATGEEAYSLAILFEEARQRLGSKCEVKIFASDVHPDSLQTASRGEYDEEKLSNVSAERLANCFTRKNGRYVVSKTIRQMVLFVPHNVLQDPPFTGLDLVSCRNLLIYFDQAGQKKALTLFHFGLKKDGVLFLGPSEALGPLSHEFATIDERCKLFSKRRDARLPADAVLPIALNPRSHFDNVTIAPVRNETSDRVELYDRLLDTVLPPTLLVDLERRVVDSFGGASRFLQFRDRRVSTQLMQVCPPELQATLSAALRQVEQTREPVRIPQASYVDQSGSSCSVSLLIRPLRNDVGSVTHYCIQLGPGEDREPAGPPAADRPSDTSHLPAPQGDVELTQRIRMLEGELDVSRDNLQATIEELEASNEELQATNEELISSNEELQSTNEELNSVNEELHTVNVEYQTKNAELCELNEDMRHLLASTDIGTLFLDESLLVRRFTPGIAPTFQLEPHDVGRPISTFSHTLHLDNLTDVLEQVIATGENHEEEVADRSGHHYFLRILPYRIDGTTSGVVLTLTNIDALVESRRLARRFERRLQEAIDAVPVFVSYVNRHERYEYANRAYKALIDGTDTSVIGKTVREVLGDSYELSRPHIRKVLEGEPQYFEQELHAQDGVIFVNVSYHPCRNSRGDVVGFYVAASDITSLKAAEAQLASAVESTQRANQAKSDFLAKMSHEIRSPMTAILGFADILEQQLESADNRNCVDVIRRNGFHLLELINDILDLSRIESGKFKLAREPLNPLQVLRECYNTVLPKAADQRIDLSLQLDDRLDCDLVGDRRRLSQIVLNLLTNAIKFSPDSRVILKGRRSPKNGHLIITVADTGIGISEADLPALFEPFRQADDSDARPHEGSGLGLSITWQLVDQMRGALRVRSRVRRGSVFQVQLPLPEADEPSDRRGQRGVELETRIPRLDGRSILLIDDRRDIRFIAEQILADAGASVDTAEDGERGLQLALERFELQQPYDCIVTDIQMPEMDGYETTRRMRASGITQPVLALTASAMAADRDRCLEAGCNAHVSKPIDSVQFVRTIASLLNGRSEGDRE